MVSDEAFNPSDVLKERWGGVRPRKEHGRAQFRSHDASGSEGEAHLFFAVSSQDVATRGGRRGGVEVLAVTGASGRND